MKGALYCLLCLGLFLVAAILLPTRIVLRTGDVLDGKPNRSPALRALASHAPAIARDANQQRVLTNYLNLPLTFEANQGQTDQRVKFLSRGRGYTMFLTSTEAVLALQKNESRVKSARLATKRFEIGNEESWSGNRRSPTHNSARRPRRPVPDVISIELVGAKAAAGITGLDPLPGKSNYFLGNDPTKWHTDVPHYARVRLENVWPGVDLVYYGNQGQLEHDFIVAPGADPRAIRLKLSGADRLAVDPSGDLVIRVRESEVRFQKPLIYQEIAGARRMVDGGYVLKGLRQVAFRVSAYDRSLPLVIDPSLLYGTFLGGSGDDFAGGVAVDAAGNAYVAGTTDSTDFLAPNSTRKGPGGGFDIFVTKIDTTKSGAASLIYSTVIGGSTVDIGGTIAIDLSGNAYVAGVTNSVDFPTVNPLSCCPSLNGPSDAFVTKLNPAGNQLLFSTYFGGRFAEAIVGGGIAVDGSGNVYVASDTKSDDLPTTPGAFQTALGTGTGVRNAFVAKIGISPANQGTLLYSTYLGGSGDQRNDRAWGIAVDGAGKVYACGGASSNFPGITPTTAFQSAYGGGEFDAFVVKMNLGGNGSSDLLYGTYLGGSLHDQALAIAVDTQGNAYVTGQTKSANFPPKNAFQTTFSGNFDAFVAKLNPSLSGVNSLVYSTYLGGGAATYGFGIAVNPFGQAYVTGETDSGNFPTRNPLQTNNMEATDAFVAKLDPALPGDASLLYSTFLGDIALDEGFAIAVDTANPTNAYVVGYTASDYFPVTPSAFQDKCKSCGATAPIGDAFLVKISDATPAKAANLAPRGLNFGFQAISTTSPSRTVILTNSGSSTLTVSNVAITGDFANTGTGTCPGTGFQLAFGGNCNFRVTFTPIATGSRTGTLSITDDAPDSPQSISLIGTGTDTGGQAAVRLDANNLTFDPQLVTTSSIIPQVIHLTNIGNGTLTVTSCPMSGPNGGDFAAACGPCASVSPNSNCTINVTFTPSSTGARSATLNITDNATPSPQMVSLSGTGTDFTLGPAGGGPTTQRVNAGGTATYNLQVASVSGYTDLVNVFPNCGNVPAASLCAASPMQVVVGPSSPGLVTVSVGTTAPRALAPPDIGRKLGPPDLMRVTVPWGLLLAALGLLTLWAGRLVPGKVIRLGVAALAAALTLLLLLAACGGGGGHGGGGGGGGGGQGTPSGTYTVTVTAGSPQIQKTLNLTLTVN